MNSNSLLFQNNEQLQKLPFWYLQDSLADKTQFYKSIMAQGRTQTIPSWFNNDSKPQEKKGAFYDFFGDTPATAMQGLGSMIGAVGGVWDAYNKNKWQKKAYALEKAAIDRQLERERIGENTLHSVWGKKDGSV